MTYMGTKKTAMYRYFGMQKYTNISLKLHIRTQKQRRADHQIFGPRPVHGFESTSARLHR